MKSILLTLLIISTQSLAKSEADWVNQTCNGKIEYTLSDRTRVDCLTDTHAFEYDFQNKWAEAIGQSLHYAMMTNKKAGIRLICRNKNCNRYVKRIQAITKYYNLDIDIEVIKN